MNSNKKVDSLTRAWDLLDSLLVTARNVVHDHVEARNIIHGLPAADRAEFVKTTFGGAIFDKCSPMLDRIALLEQNRS